MTAPLRLEHRRAQLFGIGTIAVAAFLLGFIAGTLFVGFAVTIGGC